LLDRLRLAHQGDVARRGLVPAGGDAHERLMNLLLRQPHGVIVGAMGRAFGAFRDVAAGQLGFGYPCVHDSLPAPHGHSTSPARTPRAEPLRPAADCRARLPLKKLSNPPTV